MEKKKCYVAGKIGDLPEAEYKANFEQGKKEVIAMTPQIMDEQYRQEEESNAKLIASAPRLLEACKYVVKWHREHDSGEGELFGQDFVTTCITALAEAEGE
mgnify:CR=1 FL=1